MITAVLNLAQKVPEAALVAGLSLQESLGQGFRDTEL